MSEDLTLFKALNSEQRLKILGAMVRQDLVRGEILVAQGDPSDSLYIVLHGALAFGARFQRSNQATSSTCADHRN